MMNEIPDCPECGEPFENIFDATDHLLEDEEEFDPILILPNGYKLMIGSLLRVLYEYADDPIRIKNITQDTYATLYAAETEPKHMQRFIEDLIINEQMHDIDEELEELLDDNDKGGK